MTKKTITDLEQEIKEKQEMIEKQKKDLELTRAQEMIDAKLYTKRTWRLEHTIAKDNYFDEPYEWKKFKVGSYYNYTRLDFRSYIRGQSFSYDYDYIGVI